ncbi:helicase-associated domain-containing protein [Oerskovia jenensis]|uniref:Helicase XPB/Ssl2 N-terminal domain-containing protein n=1 Tax=Oerskovia jenensis TaxID=162169 RepID=A0ABS2LHY3_9CELL|nr:helicase-associated domain-containing protein [Oerskovia jenensis]MBM7480041.1 hypothetical protein [Oerskovia jenensis]
MASTPPAPRRTFPEALRSRSDEHLVALLLQRPDLATPSPSTLRSLAARATSRTSLDRAIARIDALELQVLESVLVLGDQPARTPRTTTSRSTSRSPGDTTGTAVTVDRVLAALGASDVDAPVVRAAVAHLEEAALLWDRDPSQHTDLAVAPGLSEVLGPYPAGLGPADPSSPLAAPATSGRAGERPGADAPSLAALLAEAPPGARNILDALTWGPPVGVAPRADPVGREATTWLLRQRLLLASDERHVVLPREVALALRGGRTHARPLAHPPEPEAPHFTEETIAAEASRAAQDVVRLVAHLLALWQASPPNVLRAGGLGVRDLRRLATTLEVEEPTAAFVAELALATGLVVDDGEDPPSFTVTIAGEDWLDLPLAPRWALLAAAWASSGRTPWTVGSRDERGTLRAALEPDLSRPWVPRLRFDVLSALADRPGTALTSADLLEILRWGSPRSVPPVQAIEGLLQEAHLLGVTGVGALAPTGRALLRPDDATSAARTPAPSASSRTGPPLTAPEAALATALESVLPPEVDELLLQGDLTGIVPGRPSTALERLLEDAAEVESRGAAITVRFTPESLTRAFDAGRTADDLLADLASHSRTALPQPLDYLVRDTARRHGRLRVGSASSYVRAEDAALLTGLVEDPSLRHLSLFRIAPTVLVALVPAATLQAALRDRGLASTVEGPDGRVVRTERLRTTVRSRVGGRRPLDTATRGRSAVGPVVHQEDLVARRERYAELVPRLRAADDAALAAPPAATTREDVAPEPRGTTEPPAALGLLRDAIDAGDHVVLETIDPTGQPTRRRVKPLVLEGGRLRALDPARDAELTVAVHRIAGVFTDAPAPTQDASTDATTNAPAGAPND